MDGPELNRRQVMLATIGLVGAAVTPALAGKEDEGVTAPEDLMKEHGVLNRCLLIYEEGIRRLHAGDEVSPEVFHHTATLVQHFVEEYHERNEEKYIFPVFMKAGKLTGLVETLLTQHKAGRRVTAEIIRLSEPSLYRDSNNRKVIMDHCQRFIRMYRPHEAREDTVLFPALRTILSSKQVTSLGEEMEEQEHKVLGQGGFEKTLDQVISVEKTLGIYELAQFTPA